MDIFSYNIFYYYFFFRFSSGLYRTPGKENRFLLVQGFHTRVKDPKRERAAFIFSHPGSL